MIKKTIYSAPETELLEIRFEENLLVGSIDNENNTEKFITDEDEVDEVI